jgi:hypothetical protein
VRVCANGDCPRFEHATEYTFCTSCGQPTESRTVTFTQPSHTTTPVAAAVPAAAPEAAASTQTAAASEAAVNPEADPPRQRGWYPRPGDPAGVQRWHNGNGWTDRTTGGDTAARTQSSQPAWQWGHPTRPIPSSAGPSWSPGPSYSTSPQPYYSALPSTATTIWITIFFGLFGLIPATIHTNHARDLGVRDNRYYRAFGWTFGIAIVGWILFLVMLTACVSSAAK